MLMLDQQKLLLDDEYRLAYLGVALAGILLALVAVKNGILGFQNTL